MAMQTASLSVPNIPNMCCWSSSSVILPFYIHCETERWRHRKCAGLYKRAAPLAYLQQGIRHETTQHTLNSDITLRGL